MFIHGRSDQIADPDKGYRVRVDEMTNPTHPESATYENFILYFLIITVREIIKI